MFLNELEQVMETSSTLLWWIEEVLPSGSMAPTCPLQPQAKTMEIEVKRLVVSWRVGFVKAYRFNERPSYGSRPLVDPSQPPEPEPWIAVFYSVILPRVFGTQFTVRTDRRVAGAESIHRRFGRIKPVDPFATDVRGEAWSRSGLTAPPLLMDPPHCI